MYFIYFMLILNYRIGSVESSLIYNKKIFKRKNIL